MCQLNLGKIGYEFVDITEMHKINITVTRVQDTHSLVMGFGVFPYFRFLILAFFIASQMGDREKNREKNQAK